MINLKIKEKDYQLRLTTKGCINCEKRLGKNPLNVFMEATETGLPKFTDIMVILHECLLPYNHSISQEDVYTLFDDYCEDGGNLVSLLEIIIETFRSSGLIPKDSEEKN